MADWVKLCEVNEAPEEGQLREIEVGAVTLCMARIEGQLHVLDNLCPHREGPLGQGWIEGNTVVCPWHAWAFDCRTGIAAPPEEARVKVYPLKTEDGTVLADLT